MAAMGRALAGAGVVAACVAAAGGSGAQFLVAGAAAAVTIVLALTGNGRGARSSPPASEARCAAEPTVRHARLAEPSPAPNEGAFAREHVVLQALRDAVLVLDAAGCVVFCNRTAQQWFGLGDRAIEGRPAFELLPEELSSALHDCAQRLDLARAEAAQVTDLALGNRSLDLHLMALTEATASPGVAAVAVFTDVTRNHEIARLKDELLSSISHELRTPLTNLCSSSEILAQMSPEQEADWREFVGILHDESHRLKRLVDDVLAYGQMESSHQVWQIADHDVGHLAADALRLAAPIAKEHGTHVDLRILGSGLAHCDGPRIVEVLVRLLDNACKFGRHGGHVRLTVQQPGDLVEVAVADDGPGIPPADRQRVFERFVQVGDVLTDKPRGTGLGLSICQRIVDAMGGTLWCEDSPLGGVQFRFVLPLAVPAAAR